MSFTDFKKYGDHSTGYEKLYTHALETLKDADVDRIVVEVGVRDGGSLMTLMNAVADTDNKRYVISIDPYGGKPYVSREQIIDAMYPDDHYYKMLANVTPYAVANKVLWTHYKHTSLDWVEFWPKTDFWSYAKKLQDKFAFVHLDGDHNTAIVSKELDYFVPRTKGWVVVDDADQLVLTDGKLAKYKGTVVDNYLWIKGSDES